MIEKGFIDLGCEVVRLSIDKDLPEWILITVCSEQSNEIMSDDMANTILTQALESIGLTYDH